MSWPFAGILHLITGSSMNILSHRSNIVFLIGFVVYVGIRHVFAKRTKAVEKTIRRIDGVEKTLIFIVAVGSLLIPVLYLFTPLLGFADYRLPQLAPWFGAAIMVVSLWLFWRSHADLGLNWSVTLELRKDHQLIKHGVYRLIRHPMYASIWLWDIAQVLLLQNWLAGWAAIVSFAFLYFVRMPREERMMCDCFGQEYEQYMQQTGRLLPRIKTKVDV